MRKKIVAGNWKMNTLPLEGVELIRAIINELSEVANDVTLVVAPPFTHLSMVENEIKNCPIQLSAQNCSDRTEGAFTGEISAAMLSSIGCSYVILGHSERRKYYGEKNEVLVDKIKRALENSITPILCVGEKLEQRESGDHFNVVKQQVEEVLFHFSEDEISRMVIAYEPVWAIGTGKTATSDQAQEMHAFIRDLIAKRFGEISLEIPILYGGSANPSNAKDLFRMKDIDGGLIGTASLKAEDFIAVARSF